MSEIIHIGAGKLVGLKTSTFTIFNQEKYLANVIPTAWQEFFKLTRGTSLGESGKFYGASIPSMDFDQPMDYYAGALVPGDAEIPSGLTDLDFPEGNYLAIEHTGPIVNLAASYQVAYMEALPQSGKEMRPAPHLEIYTANLDPMAADYKMTIAIPIN